MTRRDYLNSTFLASGSLLLGGATPMDLLAKDDWDGYGWGHAYLSPQPGFFFGKDANPAPGEVLRNTPFGRIAFANSDLAGIMDHRASILEARRAVGQTIDRS